VGEGEGIAHGRVVVAKDLESGLGVPADGHGGEQRDEVEGLAPGVLSNLARGVSAGRADGA
jgi:hypothetical protein